MESADSRADYTSNGNIKMPKNIRQIGSIRDHSKTIYVEDYVMTYIKQLSAIDYTGCKVAVLLGYYIRTEDGKNLFIKGAVEMKNPDINNGTALSDEGWTSVYENIKKYFFDVEIIGWALIGPEFFLDNGDKVQKIHTDNFQGPDKALLKMDSMEKEEAFYLYDNGQLVKQSGYYIYYEKNEEMQNYMVENKETVTEERSYDDRTIRKIRNIIKEKKEPKDNRNIIRLLYAASAMLTIIVLIIAAAMLNNYGQLKNMETAINAISKSLALNQTADSDLPGNTGNTGGEDVTDPLRLAENDSDSTGGSTDDAADGKEDGSGGNKQTGTAAPENDTSEEGADRTSEDNNEEEGTMEVETVSGNISAGKDSENQPAQTDDVSSDSNSKPKNTAKDNTSKAADTSKSSTADKPKTTVKNSDTAKDTKKDEQPDSKAASAETKYYVVKAGDSLAGICLHLYNSIDYMDAVMKLNGIEDENKIYAGQKLIMP